MFSAVQRTLRLLSARERRSFNALLVGRSATAILDIVGVLLIGVIGAIAAGSLTTSSALNITVLGVDLADVATADNLLPLAAITLGFFVAKALIAIALTRAITTFVARVESNTATALTERVLYGNLSKLEAWSRSELTYSITLSMNAAFSRLLSHWATLVTEGFLLLCIGIVLFVVNPLTMLAVVLYFGIIGLIIQRLVARRQQVAGLALAASTVTSTDSMSEAVGAYREIFTLGRQDYFVGRFGEARRVMSESAGTVQFIMTLPRYIVESSLMLGAVLLIGVQLATGNLATAAATLGVFLTAGVRITASLLPFQQAASSIGQVASEAQLAHRLLDEYADTKVPGRAPVKARTEDAPGLAVELSGVGFSYDGAAAAALVDINFVAGPGEYTAIIGASGAGKSTLADLLLGLVTPSSGTIALDGSTPRELDSSAPGSIAYVPQRPGLVSGTIAENVALGREDDEIDLERVDWALAQASLAEFVATLPDGVHSSVGKQASALSGGQIQRLGLARALYARPRLLVLDEATSALDAESESIVGASLGRLHGSVTLVVIAHRLSTVQHADTVHVMENGRIIASGPFQHLLETVPVVARYAELMTLDDGKP